ncbi:MOSC N-terminal beta barrel domain-containing protein [Xylariales sp. PMI_506]|nr:MOSC N-terminal beta barrel domain-containing protein [Xylariales sp. PMI_506]
MMDGGREAYNARVAGLRDTEYPMLKDEVYLDHAGTTLYPKALVDKFAAEMTANLYGNPHSASSSSQLSTSRIEDTRLRVLQFFNADPADFDLVFVANATAAIKLVAETFRALPEGFCYAYHQASHTSLVGLREEATSSQCVDDMAIDSCLNGDVAAVFSSSSPSNLFAYPAQSNLNGHQFPLEWCSRIRAQGQAASKKVYTLLDAASYAATSPLELADSELAADFTVLSFYKIFGFPDLGALIVRRQATPVFQHRKYFGGGTVDMVVSVKEQWHASKTISLHESLEDGTLPVHSIIALDAAMDIHRQLFGSISDVALHTSFLARKLYGQLANLRHQNGAPVCNIYSPSSGGQENLVQGPVIAFNLQNQHGAWVSLAEFEKLAALKKFHVRTGGVCNPGGIATALMLQPWEIKRNFSSGFRCGSEQDIMCGKPTGVIRVSLGAMSTVSDVEKFVAFVEEFYKTDDPPDSPVVESKRGSGQLKLRIADLMVYPIKSCGGYRIPEGMSWEVRPEGLAWDREWCLVHQGTSQVLSQKRHPRMALLKPTIDFAEGVLRVSYCGPLRENGSVLSICVPLSANPALFKTSSATSVKNIPSRVCGEEITAQRYTCSAINNFFTDILGVPCSLARFPPGGEGTSMRHAKAHLQRHQNIAVPQARYEAVVTGPGLETPPDSDTEGDQRKILLSNESPILAINMASLEALNQEIESRGGKPVAAEVFRANVVIGSHSPPSCPSPAYAEDHWSMLRIGHQNFQMLGSCRRCHMVCIDQETASKSEEPFVTLTKTRRFDGKVYFGTHMCHQPAVGVGTREAQHPTIRVGDEVLVDLDG